MSDKLISVIIPVKNGANYLQEAIEGIKKQNMNMEIIVVDDASDDNTVQIAESMGCRVVKHETNKGQVAAKNTGLKEANGEFILFHDHDDVMNAGVLEQMYKAFDKDTAVVMAKVKDFLSPDATDNKAVIKPDAYYGLFTGAVLIRKNVFDTIGFFDENLNTGEIIEFSAKLDEYGFKTKKIDLIATNRRVHNTNYGKTNKNKEFKDYATVLRGKLAKK
ncbi:MAG: glycosyltransferase [Heliobacteriaceae bacterium]|jgi:glycosyltransferase involved in cell wall biosynthesis|nr:glycosyltransferase [Heliobacteriaceae bacterium]